MPERIAIARVTGIGAVLGQRLLDYRYSIGRVLVRLLGNGPDLRVRWWI
jgi:hypothetical protein